MSLHHQPPRHLATLPVHRRVTLDGTAHRALKVGRDRLVLVGALFALAYAVIALRLIDVTLIKDGFEPRLARASSVGQVQLGRRDIVDRNGVLLATNLPTASLYADPTQVLQPRAAAAQLARVLPDVTRAELLDRLTSGRRFVWIKRNLTPRQQQAVNRLGLPGVAFLRGERRAYPLGSLFAHVVGFVDIDNRGLAGAEKAFDDGLRGPPEASAEPLRLSLDARVQHLLRDALKRGMSAFRAAGAAGLVLDATSGEVLAMVSLPDFDPNRSAASDAAARFNRNTLGAYEMGSTFKIFTVAMALDSGVVTMGDGYDASEPVRAARYVIHDYKPERRWLSVPEIFIHSSNIGAAKMARDVGLDVQRDFLARLGLLERPPIELPEVAAPLVPAPWREINAMTIAYGHGLAVSPLQLTAAVAAMVNGGIYRPPTILAREGDEANLGRRVITRRTSQQMRALMRLNVVEGTGGKADVAGYLVGGKTGSAEKVAASGGYRGGKLLSSFVAAFPIDAPRYVVFAMFDEPHGTEATLHYATGGWTAAPVVARVIARLGPLAGMAARDDRGAEPPEWPLVKVAGLEDSGAAY